MNVLEIPFVEKVGIQKTSAGELELPFTETVHNHLQTIHASAQFTLAETASGECLQVLFPELLGKVIPVLRESNIKYKKPAIKSICAYPSVSDEARDKFMHAFANKGRGLISIEVDIRDADDTLTCTASFKWYLQSIDE